MAASGDRCAACRHACRRGPRMACPACDQKAGNLCNFDAISGQYVHGHTCNRACFASARQGL